jgi:hypothetical protein
MRRQEVSVQRFEWARAAMIALGVLVVPLRAQAQECVPQCRTGYTCAGGQCVKACEPACAANEVCSPQGACVSACNPSCASGEVCTPQATCVSACNPPCEANQVCTPQAECVSACNPPCGANERCEGQSCIALAPVAPAPVAPAPPPPFEPAPAEVEDARGVYIHDGFYLSFGLGLGLASGSAEPSDGVLAGETLEVSGLGVLTQLAIGGTVAPGLVIGGGLYGASIPSPEYSAEVGGVSFDDEGEASAVSQIGPFVAYYFSPGSGGHLFGAPVFSVVTGGEAKEYSSEIPETSGTGFGLVLGGGYEFWVGEQWSIGVIGRLQYVSADMEDDEGDETEFSGTVFGALVTATLH